MKKHILTLIAAIFVALTTIVSAVNATKEDANKLASKMHAGDFKKAVEFGGKIVSDPNSENPATKAEVVKGLKALHAVMPKADPGASVVASLIAQIEGGKPGSPEAGPSEPSDVIGNGKWVETGVCDKCSQLKAAHIEVHRNNTVELVCPHKRVKTPDGKIVAVTSLKKVKNSAGQIIDLVYSPSSNPRFESEAPGFTFKEKAEKKEEQINPPVANPQPSAQSAPPAPPAPPAPKKAITRTPTAPHVAQ